MTVPKEKVQKEYITLLKIIPKTLKSRIDSPSDKYIKNTMKRSTKIVIIKTTEGRKLK